MCFRRFPEVLESLGSSGRLVIISTYPGDSPTPWGRVYVFFDAIGRFWGGLGNMFGRCLGRFGELFGSLFMNFESCLDRFREGF